MTFDDEYCFLFPFELVPAGSDIVIYGAGNLGEKYIKQLETTKYANIAAVIDKNFENKQDYIYRVQSIESIKDIKYDYIIIAVSASVYQNTILADLYSYGVDLNKCIYIGKRKNAILSSIKKNDDHDFLYKCGGITVAIRLSSGMGDSIIVKKLIVRLLELVPSIGRIDLFGNGVKDYINAFYSDVDKIFNVEEHNMAKYEDVYKNYMLAIRWQCVVIIDHVELDKIKEIDEKAANLIEELNKYINCLGFSDDWSANILKQVNAAKYRHQNEYNVLYYSDVLGINDTYVNIPFDRLLLNKLTDELGNYITVNYGNGSFSDDNTKQWPFEYFCSLVELIKTYVPGVKVIQVSGKSSKKIRYCDIYYLGESLEKVKCVLKQSILHIDIEGGVVHLATQLGTKCAVIFGGTQYWYYGYDKNINIYDESCNGCAYISPAQFECYAGYERPECLYRITPEIVFDRIKDLLNNK